MAADEKCDQIDRGHVIGETLDGKPVVEVHDENHQNVVGVGEHVKPGSPVRDREGYGLWYRHKDGTVERVRLAVGHGPRQVATKAYRDGWDAVWSKGGDA